MSSNTKVFCKFDQISFYNACFDFLEAEDADICDDGYNVKKGRKLIQKKRKSPKEKETRGRKKKNASEVNYIFIIHLFTQSKILKILFFFCSNFRQPRYFCYESRTIYYFNVRSILHYILYF